MKSAAPAKLASVPRVSSKHQATELTQSTGVADFITKGSKPEGMMAEVLVEFDWEFKGPDGKLYEARACGREREDRLWEGWLEFTPVGGGVAMRTARETTQPNRDHTLYWATGLTETYIEGALVRVLGQPLPNVRTREVRSRPAYEAPADTPLTGGAIPPHASPVLDPFRVYAEGDHLLRAQLNALDEGQLRTIVRAYAIADEGQLAVASRVELISLIMLAVEKGARVI
jgi:hypothetical protein